MSSLPNIMKYLGAALASSPNPKEKLATPMLPPTPSVPRAMQTLSQGLMNDVAPQSAPAPQASSGPASALQGPQRLLLSEFFNAVQGDPAKAEQIIPGITTEKGAEMLQLGPDGNPYVEIKPEQLDIFRTLARGDS